MDDTEDDIISEDEAENTGAALKRLREKLSAAVKEKQEYLEGWQRARADFANFKKDEGARAAELEARARSKTLQNFLPALNALEQAIKNPHFKEAPKEWQAGFAAVWSEFLKSLSRLGVTCEEPLPDADAFDPQKHEILQEVPTDKKEKDHLIAQVFSNGYESGGNSIQPAHVAVYVYNNKDEHYKK